MAKPINEVKRLFEDMTVNNYHWESEQGHPRKGGRHAIDAFSMLASKVDALFQKIDRLQPTPSYRGTPCESFRQASVSEVCGI